MLHAFAFLLVACVTFSHASRVIDILVWLKLKMGPSSLHRSSDFKIRAHRKLVVSGKSGIFVPSLCRTRHCYFDHSSAFTTQDRQSFGLYEEFT